MSTALYRLYDDSDDLLYVGITNNVTARMGQHAADKPWWQMVSRATIEHYESRAEARRAEQDAIDAGSPRFNRIRSCDQTPMRSFRCDDELWGLLGEWAEKDETNRTTVVIEALRAYLGRAS